MVLPRLKSLLVELKQGQLSGVTDRQVVDMVRVCGATGHYSFFTHTTHTHTHTHTRTQHTRARMRTRVSAPMLTPAPRQVNGAACVAAGESARERAPELAARVQARPGRRGVLPARVGAEAPGRRGEDARLAR
jgi:hypothetical protein